MLSFIVIGFEKSDRYLEAAVVTALAVPLLVYVYFLPGVGPLRLVEQWAAGHDVDRGSALAATYAASRGAVARGLASTAVWGALLFAVVAVIAGATWSRLAQYGLLGACLGLAAIFPNTMDASLIPQQAGANYGALCGTVRVFQTTRHLQAKNRRIALRPGLIRTPPRRQRLRSPRSNDHRGRGGAGRGLLATRANRGLTAEASMACTSRR
jgi:hypothetical protein